ncbi:MAG: glycoside hydrolase [Oscillospiraceae bacterium]|nr:glycoside hydrolase [Oscillospiraceae bacterium]
MMSKKKITSGVMAAAIALNTLLAVPFTASALQVRGEFEDGTLENDAQVESSVAGFSGTGYVNLKDNSSTIPSATTTVNIDKAGSYALVIGYSAPYGTKGATIEVNGESIGQVMFEETEKFAELNVGKVAFKEGENTIKLNSTWGYTLVDYVEVRDYVAPERPEIKATQTNTCDPKAIDSAKALMSYLSSIYGKNILSGQQEIYMNGPHDVEQEFKYIEEKTGKLPAIRGFDYGNFTCPAFGGDDGSTERVIAWAAKGGICTASWHLNVPTDFSSYTIGDRIDWAQTTYSEKTDFSPSKAIQEGTKDNAYLTQALDTLATEFLELQEKGISLLWRPYHEAEGNGGENGSWFWWGREGSKVYRELYIYTYKYLTETKGCHNLIWEWNSYDYSTSANWYPGDNYVDIIGYDKYNCTDWSTGSAQIVHNDSPIADTFYNIMERYNNAKMVALMECDCFSTVENLTTEKAGWLYFMPWYDGGSDDSNFLSNPQFNREEDLIEMYQSDYCITLDELPKLTDIKFDPDATNPVENTDPTDPQPGHAVITVDDKGNFHIDLPEADDTIYLVVDLGDDATYANGGLGVSVPVGDKYYWANVKWEASKNGETKVDLVDQLFNVTLSVDGENVEITDEAVLDTIKKALVEQKSFEGQIWWAGKGEDPVATTGVKITDAYIKKGKEDPVETTEPDTKNPGTEKIWGDADGNGQVEILDVVLMNRVYVGVDEISPEGKQNADVDQDNKITLADSMNVLKLLVHLLTNKDFPVKAEN